MIDYHLHTHHSVDAVTTMESAVATALVKGAREVGLADHLEFDPRDRGYRALDGSSYLNEGRNLARRLKEQLTVRVGVEAGEPHLHRDDLQAFTDRYQVDFVLGAIHWVGDHLVGTEGFFREHSQPMRPYLESVREMVLGGDLDVLAHLDFPARYMIEGGQKWDPIKDRDLVEEILRLILERDISLEVNSAGYRRGLGRPQPPVEVLRWYRDMGGEMITVGSDAHRDQDVLSGVEASLEILDQLGYRTLTGFCHREPYSVSMSDLTGPGGA